MKKLIATIALIVTLLPLPAMAEMYDFAYVLQRYQYAKTLSIDNAAPDVSYKDTSEIAEAANRALPQGMTSPTATVLFDGGTAGVDKETSKMSRVTMLIRSDSLNIKATSSMLDVACMIFALEFDGQDASEIAAATNVAASIVTQENIDKSSSLFGVKVYAGRCYDYYLQSVAGMLYFSVKAK